MEGWRKGGKDRKREEGCTTRVHVYMCHHSAEAPPSPVQHEALLPAQLSREVEELLGTLQQVLLCVVDAVAGVEGLHGWAQHTTLEPLSVSTTSPSLNVNHTHTTSTFLRHLHLPPSSSPSLHPPLPTLHPLPLPPPPFPPSLLPSPPPRLSLPPSPRLSSRLAAT